MMGHHFGVPGHRQLQRRIIIAALEHVVTAKQSGEIARLPITWVQARKEGKQIEQAMGRAT
jgi:hypothetical protein